MSSTPINIVVSDEEKDKIKKLLKDKTIPECVKKRLNVIFLLSEGELSYREIADKTGVSSTSSICKIRDKFIENGIESLFDSDKSIKNKDIKGNYLSEIKGFLDEKNDKNIKVKPACIAENLNISLTTVYKYLNELFSLDKKYLEIVDCNWHNPENCNKNKNIDSESDTLITVMITKNDKVIFLTSASLELGFNSDSNINSISSFIKNVSIIEENIRSIFRTFFIQILYFFVTTMFIYNTEKRRIVKIDTLFGTIKVPVPKSIAILLAPNQHLQTDAYKYLTSLVVQNASFRAAAIILNAALGRADDDQISYRTLCDRSMRSGKDLMYKQKEEAEEIIENVNIEFDQNNSVYINDEMSQNRNTTEKRSTETSNENVKNVADNYNKKNNDENKIDLEKNYDNELEVDPDKTVYISSDIILVKHQNEERCVNGKTAKKSSDYVSNAVGVLSTVSDKILSVAETVYSLFFLIFSMVIKNNLLYNQIVFFYDGQRSLLEAFNKFFWWKRDTIVILDWYHLSKKIIECISMGIKGSLKFKEEKTEIKRKIKTMLWYGNIEDAKNFILNIEPCMINDKSKLDNLIAYLNKHESEIICYALRKALGLKNGSSMVESANNELVARRQKRNGSSWSYQGSLSMAANTCQRKNKKL